MKVFFQLKKAKENDKMVIISALCTKASGPWSMFEKADRCPKQHPAWVQKLVEDQTFTSTIHVPYELSESEKGTYVNKDGKFVFNRKLLAVRSKQLPKQLSIAMDDEEDSCDEELSEQNDETIDCSASKKLKTDSKPSSSKQVASKAGKRLANFKIDGNAKKWIVAYERFIRASCGDSEDFLIEDALFENIFKYLDSAERIWAYSQEKDNWTGFRNNFAQHFDAEFWKRANSAVFDKHPTRKTLKEHIEEKLKLLSSCDENLSDRFKILICLLSVDEKHRKKLGNCINGSVESFLEQAEGYGQTLPVPQPSASSSGTEAAVTREEFAQLQQMLSALQKQAATPRTSN